MVGIYVLLSAVIVLLIVFVFRQNKNKDMVEKETELQVLNEQISTLKADIATLTERSNGLSAQNANLSQQSNTLSAQNATLSEQNSVLREQVATQQNENRNLNSDIEEKINSINTLQQQNDNFVKETISLKEEVAKLQNENNSLKESKQREEKILTDKITLLSNEILDKQSKNFTSLNEKSMQTLLEPLKEKITSFEKQVQDTYEKNLKDSSSLRQTIVNLQQQTMQMTTQTQNLTSALKGDSKMQGDWGEVQVELILQKAGLEKDVNYHAQENIKDEQGNNFRPDFLVDLPDDKHFIIDSKVSLTAYEQYFNEEDTVKKDNYLKEHIKSVRKHIDELSIKNYQQDFHINTVDYVFMYLALEPAFFLALQNDRDIFDYAMRKNVVIVSTTTLLATMRTVSFIWKQENQRKNILQIVNESGKLYDKFVAYIDDMKDVGKAMDNSKKKYVEAMNKLFESTKRGDTIIGRMENIKKLGANATKQLDQNLLSRIEEPLSLEEPTVEDKK